jgi:hypothetical protein
MEPELRARVMTIKRNPWILSLLGLGLAAMFALLLHAWYWALVLRGAPEQEGIYFFIGIAALVLGAPTSIVASLSLGPVEPVLVRFGITSLQFILAAMVVNWTLIGFMIGWWQKRKALHGSPPELTPHEVHETKA